MVKGSDSTQQVLSTFDGNKLAILNPCNVTIS